MHKEKAQKLNNFWGSLALQPEIVNRLDCLLKTPTAEAWDDCYCLLIKGTRTLWQFVLEVDPTFPRSVKIEEGPRGPVTVWPRVPDQFTLYRAIRQATGVPS